MKRFSLPATKAGFSRSVSLRFLIACGLVAALIGVPSAIAGFGGFGNNGAVGGVVIDASGLVKSATQAERLELLASLRNRVGDARGEMATQTELRMISLKKLQAALEAELKTGQSVPEDMQMLAGLQRIEYVFVYPEKNDIVLAGPAEPWVVRNDASVVGKTSGRPVLLLSDLITAFRAVEPSRNGGITCSIEPTAEGRQRLNNMLRRVQLRPGQDPRNFEPMMREAYGPQQVKLNNIPADSHFARVLLAADFQMKRIAMALEPAPIDGLPSYLQVARNRVHAANENPRWWMACNYDSLKRDADRLAWKIGGQGVKTLTAEELFNEAGELTGEREGSKAAAQWASMMTEKFDELAASQSIFGDLRNVMDLSVVATLIAQEGLDQRAGCDLSTLMGKGVEVPMVQYQVPRAVEPQCSFVRTSKGWTVTASGGVEVTAFDVVSDQEVAEELSEVHEKAEATEDQSWWWNS